MAQRSLAEREHIARVVLEAPIGLSLRKIARRVGIHPDSVRQIRYGIIYRDVLPELPRFAKGTAALACSGCTHHSRRTAEDCSVVGVCDLGFPESSQPGYARECAAYWPAPAGAAP